MRCQRCGKRFDEEMYSGICPKCGHFHNRQTEYDVNKYISARFEDAEKTSTDAQAQKQHADLHKMYDNNSNAAAQHAKLHKTYDKKDPHKPGAQQGNPYQPPGQNGAYQQGNIHPAGQTGAYRQANVYPADRTGAYRQAGSDGEAKERNIVTPVCIAIAVLAILSTVFYCYLEKRKLTDIYNTLDYEQQYAGAGELFEIDERLLLVEKAEVIDTSMSDDMPAGEKLVAVTVKILPVDERYGNSGISGRVYVSDGHSCKQYLDSWLVYDFLGAEDVLNGYDYLDYSTEEMDGRFYFFVDEDAEEVTISFDEDKEKNSIYVMQKRVSVPLRLEEETP